MPISRSAADRLVDHLQIARLEDVERHAAAGKQQRRRQRKHRDRMPASRPRVGNEHFPPARLTSVSRTSGILANLAQPARPARGGAAGFCLQENSSDDNLRRAASVASSVMPQASKNLQQLRPRAVVVPAAVGLDDGQQIVRRLARACPARSGSWRGRSAPDGRFGSAASRRSSSAGLPSAAASSASSILARTAASGRRVLLVLRAPAEHRARRLGVAGLEQQIGQPGQRLDISGALLEHGRIDVGGGLRVAGRARLGRGGQRLGDARRPPPLPTTCSMNSRIWLSGMAPMKPSTGWPSLKAMTAGIDWMPSWPAIDGWSSMFILTSLTLPPAARDRLFQRRRELLARTAPRRPEIDQHRLLARFLDARRLGEACGRGVLDQVCRGRVADAGRRGGRRRRRVPPAGRADIATLWLVAA